MKQDKIHTYLLCSKHEVDRVEYIDKLKYHFGNISCVEAIFPKYQKVPFVKDIIKLTKYRTGKALNEGEIGCLLGHRKIWHLIAKHTANPNQHFLVLESDSKIINFDDFKTTFTENFISNKTVSYDLFFWGAWHGNARLKKSTTKLFLKKYRIGVPLIKSVYCTYGYSVSAVGAKILLKKTSKFNYPIDFFKCHLQNTNISIGAIRPAMIDTWQSNHSYIQLESKWFFLKRWIIIRIFDFRNMIIAYFC